MKANQFKEIARLIEKSAQCIVELITRSEMIDYLAFDGSVPGSINDDTHAYAFCGDEPFCDDEITPAIAKKADYIEYSWGDGWAFFIGRKASENALDDAFESTLGWWIDCRKDFGEMPEDLERKINEILAA